MPYRKLTLRRAPPVTREYMKLLNSLESVLVKGKHLVKSIQAEEQRSIAMQHHQCPAPVEELFNGKEAQP